MQLAKSKLWIVLTVILGLITSTLVYYYLNGVKVEAAGQDLKTVVVAAQKVPQGTLLTKDMVKTINVPEKYLPSGTIANIDSAINQYSTVDLWPESIIVSGQLASSKNSQQLSYKIPADKRAITIAVNTTSGVGGQIKPGQYVDVLVSYKTANNFVDNKVVTLLQNVLILSTGSSSSGNQSQDAQIPDNVTLAVSPQEAQLVTLSETVGKIKLVLRQTADDKKQDLKQIDPNGLQPVYP